MERMTTSASLSPEILPSLAARSSASAPVAMSETTTEPAPGGAATIEREHQAQLSEPGDHERFAHYVDKNKIMESALDGGAVVALCGKVWTPSRDPEKFPICPECKEIYEELTGGGSGEGSNEGSSGKRGFFGFGKN